MSIFDFEASRARWKRDGEIHCPYCDRVYCDDEYHHVSCWGEDEPRSAYCGSCEEEFFVKEHVRRTYTTSRTSETERDITEEEIAKWDAEEPTQLPDKEEKK